ncbi:MAG: hypothetical protein ACOYN0_14565 [Phycisphaerales bacterium]
MHVLTKIFIVIAAVLSVALSTLVIAYAVNTDRVLSNYTSLQALSQSQDAKITDLQSKLSTGQVGDRARLQQADQEIATLRAALSDLDAAKAQLEAEKNRAESARQAVESKIAELGETVKTQASLIQSYTDEVRALRTSEFNSRKAALDMEDRMSDLESQKEVLEQNYRALQEELAEFRRSSELARSGIDTASSGSQPFTYAGPIIYGLVDEAAKDTATGGTLVKVNIGSNDRVSKNMRFGVHRNGEFIGNLVIITVDLKHSIAKFDDLNTGKTVEAGDKVQSRFQ